MSNLKYIKRRIASIRGTRQITKTMKMISAAKLKKAQNAIVRVRPYSKKLREAIGLLIGSIDGSAHPFLEIRKIQRIALIVVTGDRGLCGAFNMNILKTAQNFIHKSAEKHEISIVPIGKKASDFFRKKGFKILHTYARVFQNLNYERIGDMALDIKQAFIKGEIDVAFLIYNEFKSAAQQGIVFDQLLPVMKTEFVKAWIDNNLARPPEIKEIRKQFVFEPEKEKVLDSILNEYVANQLFRAMLESVAAELAARMTAMELATKNADEMINKLTLQYNKTRQAAITNELIEIIGGAEVLK